jgi:predicted nucleic acid-binding protein
LIRPIAVVDTSAVLRLLDTSKEEPARTARAHAELAIEGLERQNARFVVPTPVIAELCQSGPGSEVLREVARTVLSKLRIEVLDEDAADIAGAICRLQLQARDGRERGAVKYDALIAGIAHQIGARWLLTSDGDHMRKCFAAINSSVQVLIVTEPPSTGQQVFVQLLKPATEER